MIALNETDETAAEVPFFLPLRTNPLAGATGLTWTDAGGGRTSQVQYRLPGGVSWLNATIAKIREVTFGGVGFGRYALRLVASECLVAGNVLIRTSAAGIPTAQPYGGAEPIGTTGGDLPLSLAGQLVFYLPQSADPILGLPITGYAFSSGEVKLALPNATYANVSPANIVELANGFYAVNVSAADTTTRGKAYLYATATGAQRWEGFYTFLGVSTGTVIPPTPPTPVPSPVSPASSVYTDHVQLALDRLPAQFRNAP
jgi:hypothetical protein